jgi:predicted 2-oxoglutarate/Fe(II)-dependent dioxygenase YbiX
MDYHVDHIHSLFDGQHRGIPILSIITLLNEDYKGGEFCFKLDGKEVEYKLKTGECLIWPSLFMYPHYVKPVTEGTRQSFVVWAF